ncbi:MAG TPA: nicotinate phosphoribosyltransferase [Pirellulales bacterium]|jgi:nicotinate phosphoribosyltransferase
MPLESNLLLTDLYQLTMLQCYDRAGLRDVAVFDFFVRRLPKSRNFLIAAGLEQALDYLEAARFSPDELDWLNGCGHFAVDFVGRLAEWRFTGDVEAMPEGTVFFAGEPILRVTAPLPEAQLVESRLINLVQYQTMIASKAARTVLAAPDRQLVDFGFRRAHGAEAGLLAARAAYLTGFAGTATVAAGQAFGILLFGTMAHSLVQAMGDDGTAFLEFARACPNNVVFLLDTYDTAEGARATVRVAKTLSREGISVRSVRIDSGDLAAHARKVRRILDDGGLRHVSIFASGGLDEYEVAKLVATGAPIAGFGVGTSLDVSADAPYLDCVYKLAEYAGRPTRKLAEGKATWPGRKQVFRQTDQDGRLLRDVIGLEEERQAGDPLLVPVMKAGKRLAPHEPLSSLRERCARQLDRLPTQLRSLEPVAPYDVQVSHAVRALAAEADALASKLREPRP